MAREVLVLGAGIVGVSVAVHLAGRGHAVTLIDRKAPGQETSFGNAGLIQREGVEPYNFPQKLSLLARYLLNNRIDAHYHAGALPRQLGFLARYWWKSRAASHEAITRLYAPLIERSIAEHAPLIEAAGAGNLIRKEGWQQAFRSEAVRDLEFAAAERLAREHGLGVELLDAAEFRAREPSFLTPFAGALRWTDPWTVMDPLALTESFVGLFEKRGGRVAIGDAQTLTQTGSGWRVMTADGPVTGDSAVLALGPWGTDLAARLGYRFPFGVKRGYHMHYAAAPGARLGLWTLDAERGYFLAPMNRGIRLTTGAEFADRDAPKTPVQLARAEAMARTTFPLGARLDPEPWMGARPCTPDMMPVIGPAPRHKGLWFAFGHAHHGLTLGPVTGRLIAEMIDGETPVVPVEPYRAERFRP